jgi:hypothetical protein
MNLVSKAFLVATAISICSCASIDSFMGKHNVNLQNVTQYAYPSTKLIALGILNSSKTIEERNNKKKDLLFITGKVKSFTLPTHPTPGSIYEDSDLLSDKKTWELLLYTIAQNYELFLDKNSEVTVETVSLFFSETARALDEVASM